MVLKRGLSAALVASFVFPATIPLSALALDVSTLASTTSTDPMDLIIRAMQATNSTDAHALLEQAKARIAHENLTDDQLAPLYALIAKADARIVAQGANFSANKSLNLPPTQPLPSQGTSATKPIDTDAIIAKLIASNQDLRETMRDLNQARIDRDSRNLEAVVYQATGKSVADQDKKNSQTDAAANDVDALIKSLQSIPYFFKDWSVDNRALIDAHPEIPLDDLAQSIINDKKWESAALGATERVLNASGFSTKIKVAGVSVDAIGQFVVNANLILRLTDLYGVKLDESQQRIVIMMCIAGGKYGILAGKRIGQVQALADAMGEAAVNAFWKVGDASLGNLWRLSLRAKFMQTLVSGMTALATKTKTAAQEAIARQNAANAVAAGAPAAVVAEEGAAAAAAGEVKQEVKNEVASGAADIDKPLSAVQMRRLVPQVLFGGVRSYAETWWIGHFTKNFLASARMSERELETKDFQAFLTGDRGIGVTKLLIAAMNAQKHPLDVINVKTTKENQAQFILNLNHSAKVCSASELQRFQTLTKSMPANKLLQIKTLNDHDYQILRFACDTTLGSSRFDQMATEFLTFNAIPDWEVAALRLGSYANRVRVGEILMQFQFLNGDPDETAKIFFNTTVSTILGLNRPEDADYFENFFSFIRLHGGMKADPSSPSGFSVANVVAINPWDEKVGYTVSGGPAVPAAPLLAAPVVKK